MGLVINNLVLKRTLERFLVDLLHEVHPASTLSELGRFPGSHALETDAIITELQIGDKESQDALQAIQICRPTLPVILVARNLWNILDTNTAIQCGIQAYLRIPLSLLELELMLIRLAARSDRSRQWATPRALSFSSGPPLPRDADEESPITICAEEITGFSTDRTIGTDR